MDGMLSQEEIDALTGAASTMTAAPSSTMTLTDAERDAIGESPILTWEPQQQPCRPC